jgi:MFS transporter, DHA1 family, tetracycline resistance protein
MKLTGPFLFILTTLMIDAIGVGIVSPIRPDLMDRVGSGSAAEGALWGGVMMSAYAAAMFVFGPVVGSLSDAYGRRPILIVALATLAIDYIIMAMAQTYWVLLMGRIIAGMAGATYITATAYISDITKPEERGAAFGMIGAAFGVGFVFGPALGGISSGWHVTAPFWIAAALSTLNMVFGFFVLPESLNEESRRSFSKRDLNPFASIVRAFLIPGLTIPLICIFVFEFANMVYPTIWAFWGRERAVVKDARPDKRGLPHGRLAPSRLLKTPSNPQSDLAPEARGTRTSVLGSAWYRWVYQNKALALQLLSANMLLLH